MKTEAKKKPDDIERAVRQGSAGALFQAIQSHLYEAKRRIEYAGRHHERGGHRFADFEKEVAAARQALDDAERFHIALAEFR